MANIPNIRFKANVYPHHYPDSGQLTFGNEMKRQMLLMRILLLQNEPVVDHKEWRANIRRVKESVSQWMASKPAAPADDEQRRSWMQASVIAARYNKMARAFRPLLTAGKQDWVQVKLRWKRQARLRKAAKEAAALAAAKKRDADADADADSDVSSVGGDDDGDDDFVTFVEDDGQEVVYLV